ncbi:MAG: hypothetical protein H6716_12040 [Polyangiaceae bacterium]|nr:hypothetical protein [Polyangiaceae bacterium]
MNAWLGRGSGAICCLAALSVAACSSDSEGGGEGGSSAAGSAGAATGGGGSGGVGATGGGAGTSGGTGASAGSGGTSGAAGSAGAGATGGSAGIGGSAGASGAGGGPPQTVTLDYDFNQGLQGWSTGFADYADGTLDLQLDSGSRPLPSELGSGKGLMIQGHNRSDDLFMFIKRSVGPEVGLRALVKYHATLRVEFASNAQSGCTGIGGAPGESVFLKFGLTPINPVPVLMGGVWRMNVDKGDQGTAGPVGTLAGDIANGQTCDGNPTYETLSRTRILDVDAQADQTGVLWFLIGTDSDYPGSTQLYYLKVHAVLEPTT